MHTRSFYVGSTLLQKCAVSDKTCSKLCKTRILSIPGMFFPLSQRGKNIHCIGGTPGKKGKSLRILKMEVGKKGGHVKDQRLLGYRRRGKEEGRASLAKKKRLVYVCFLRNVPRFQSWEGFLLLCPSRLHSGSEVEKTPPPLEKC